MKWIGQHIYDLISRFRSDVYLEDISSGTIASGGNLGLDSNNKIVKATDSAPDADASTKGIVELATTAETTTGTDATRAVTPDGLKDGFRGSTNITTVGTIGTGTWQGTAVASDQQKHLMHYMFSGYSEGNGSTYEMPVVAHDNQAPFEHNTSTGSAGTDAISIQNQVRTNGKVMPRAVTLKKWTGWVAGEGTGSVSVGLFKLTPADNSTSTVSPVLLDAFTFTAANNNTSFAIAETTFTVAAVAAGDIVFSGILAVNNKDVYFTSTLEVEFDG